MNRLGVHFALDQEDEAMLLELDEDGRIEFISTDIEERLFGTEYACETDAAWTAIHRCFDGGELTYNRESALQMAVLGGEPLCHRDDYLISYKPARDVRAIARAVVRITEPEMRALYFAIDPRASGFEATADDWTYTWGWFLTLRRFYDLAAWSRRAVIFTADH